MICMVERGVVMLVGELCVVVVCDEVVDVGVV